MQRQVCARLGVLPALLWLMLIGALPAHAQFLFHVSMDTSPLMNNACAPFYINFQMNDGSGIGDGNNTVTLSNFNFGSGAAGPSGATYAGGASGDLSSGVSLTDNAFFNAFTQEFTPGSTLDFDGQITTNTEVGTTPDQFTFALLDSSLTEIPTLSGASNVFVQIDLDVPTPTVQAFDSDPTHLLGCGGPGVAIAAPSTSVIPTVVPEPGTLSLLGAGLLTIMIFWCRSRKISACR